MKKVIMIGCVITLSLYSSEHGQEVEEDSFESVPTHLQDENLTEEQRAAQLRSAQQHEETRVEGVAIIPLQGPRDQVFSVGSKKVPSSLMGSRDDTEAQTLSFDPKDDIQDLTLNDVLEQVNTRALPKLSLWKSFVDKYFKSNYIHRVNVLEDIAKRFKFKKINGKPVSDIVNSGLIATWREALVSNNPDERKSAQLSIDLMYKELSSGATGQMIKNINREYSAATNHVVNFLFEPTSAFQDKDVFTFDSGTGYLKVGDGGSQKSEMIGKVDIQCLSEIFGIKSGEVFVATVRDMVDFFGNQKTIKQIKDERFLQEQERVKQEEEALKAQQQRAYEKALAEEQAEMRRRLQEEEYKAQQAESKKEQEQLRKVLVSETTRIKMMVWQASCDPEHMPQLPEGLLSRLPDGLLPDLPRNLQEINFSELSKREIDIIKAVFFPFSGIMHDTKTFSEIASSRKLLDDSLHFSEYIALREKYDVEPTTRSKKEIAEKLFNNDEFWTHYKTLEENLNKLKTDVISDKEADDIVMLKDEILDLALGAPYIEKHATALQEVIRRNLTVYSIKDFTPSLSTPGITYKRPFDVLNTLVGTKLPSSADNLEVNFEGEKVTVRTAEGVKVNFSSPEEVALLQNLFSIDATRPSISIKALNLYHFFYPGSRNVPLGSVLWGKVLEK